MERGGRPAGLGIAETALLNERFRNANSPGIADAHQFDSHRFPQLFTSDYIVITLAPRCNGVRNNLPRIASALDGGLSRRIEFPDRRYVFMPTGSRTSQSESVRAATSQAVFRSKATRDRAVERARGCCIDTQGQRCIPASVALLRT